ncbi:HAD family hydrolase [Actinokineospora spheciospongiae]|uniref:HAD family hydrolase n=1 Tax=Actinokineospora spheciospongiae TaxID=909613 RepID=UPI000D7110C8|nr:HAD family hydrolase [Actinokineospora spheciospongiae]PWW53120.1 HAD superfamily hydrolase (TIGR01549 family) [Actinokineospora spheciospongiae]
MLTAVVFDIGETLIDDSREWRAWADWVGVPAHTISALVGAVTAMGRDNAAVFEYIRPGFDLHHERQLRENAGLGERIEEADLYPDVRSGLARLRDRSIWVGVAGNQTARVAALLRELDLPVDAIATSGEWGVAKPAPEFFDRVLDMVPGTAEQTLYVGDHRDNDILAATAAGLRTALIRRGPWGYLGAEDDQVRANADWVIDSLDELVDLV